VDILLKDDITLGSSFMVKREAFSPKKKYQTPQQMKFFNIFLFLWVILVLLDPDPDQQHWSKGWISDKNDYCRSENHSVLDLTFLWCAL
jgi:hypothetical protein